MQHHSLGAEPLPLPVRGLTLGDAARLMLEHRLGSLLVETPTRRFIIDTCIGNDKPRDVKNWHMRKGRFLEDMAEVAFAQRMPPLAADSDVAWVWLSD